MMTEITDRVKEQLDQFNNTIDQLVSASRGLYLRIKEEGNKQFNELVEAGQSQDTEELLKEIREDVTEPFEDVKGTLEQLKKASIGLIVKARESGDKYFHELVELGQSADAQSEEASSEETAPKAETEQTA